MLYNVLVDFVFAQLHYTTKKAASFLFLDAAFSFVFLQPLGFMSFSVIRIDAGLYEFFPFRFQCEFLLALYLFMH